MFLLSLFCVDAHAQVAITEFVNDTLGDENIHEWVEVYNYSGQDVDMSGWSLSDEDTDFAIIGQGVVIPAGGFVVFTEDPQAFIANWSVGTEGVDVFNVAIGSLANTSDEIVLMDGQGGVVWSLAYADDDMGGYATVLVELDPQMMVSGSKAAPGVVRAGDDNMMQGFLGYETYLTYQDNYAFTGVNGDLGSPLAGDYGGVVTPEPELVISGQCPGAVTMTFTNMTPNGDVAILSANQLGQRAIPQGPCAGVVSNLGNGLTLRRTMSANGQGGGQVTINAGAGACGSPIQVLDVATCTFTNVDAL